MAFDDIFRESWWPAVAALAAKVQDLQLAEDSVQEACLAALGQWPSQGIPDRPTGWLIGVARRKAIDRLRRESARQDKESKAAAEWQRPSAPMDSVSAVDDQLALIFACCHPALDPSVRIALTLRSVCGLSTAEIASAFLVPQPAMAKRLVRGTHKIRDAGIRFKVPDVGELPRRLTSVLRTIYLIFTQGHQAAAGAQLVRPTLCESAIGLARSLTRLLPDEPEVAGLLALFLLTDARRAARVTDAGNLVLLQDQDRSLWNRTEIDEGLRLIEATLAHRRPGPYQLWAAIAAVHSEAATPEGTDWPQILRLYDELLQYEATDVVRANRAVAVSMVEGPLEGLIILDGLSNAQIADWPQFHIARAELLSRLSRVEEAAAEYGQALSLERQETVRAHVEKRLAAVAPRSS